MVVWDKHHAVKGKNYITRTRIIGLYKGRDGIIRSVMVKHHNGKEFPRALQNLGPLELRVGIIDSDCAPQNTDVPAIGPVIDQPLDPTLSLPTIDAPAALNPRTSSAGDAPTAQSPSDFSG